MFRDWIHNIIWSHTITCQAKMVFYRGIFWNMYVYLSKQLKNYHYHCTVDVGIIRIVGDGTNQLVPVRYLVPILVPYCTEQLRVVCEQFFDIRKASLEVESWKEDREVHQCHKSIISVQHQFGRFLDDWCTSLVELINLFVTVIIIFVLIRERRWVFQK